MSRREGRSDLEEEEQLILLTVGALGRPLRSKIKMQKLIFLIGNVIEGLNEDLGYEPHLFGPYSEKVENMAEGLIDLGYIDHRGSSFELTSDGKEEYDRLNPSDEIECLVDDFKAFINDMTDDEVMTYIYTFYPDYIEESTKWDELKKDRINRSIRLLQRQKLSMGKAAAVAGMNTFDFAEHLRNQRIKWR